MTKKKSNAGLLALICLTGLLGTGCQTSNEKDKGLTLYRQGKMPEAVKWYSVKAEKEIKTRDAIFWRLQQAASLRAAGQYPESNQAFDLAEQQINDFEEKAKVQVGREALALGSSQANLPYRGRAYDKIMLNTYKALNDLQLGETDKARVELIRASQRQ